MTPLDYVNLGYIWLKSYPKLRRIWSGRCAFDSIKISYGFDRVPGHDELVFGGKVKLQDLSGTFPHTLQNPNILYLVSSALPYFPIRLARMAKKVGAKIVINQNGVAYPGWYGKGWEKENRVMSVLHSMADYVFYQSSFCKLSAETFLAIKDYRGGGEILYNPVDTEFFRPSEKYKRGVETPVLLLSGSHWSTYRVFTALETLKIVLETHTKAILRIAGRFCWKDDPSEAEKDVFEYAAGLGVSGNVQYVGPYSQAEAPGILNDCTLLLHTKYNDPCPRLVVEAMACGLPVVYSATGGVAELVGDDGGVGVTGPTDWHKDHPPSPEDLVACIKKVIDNRTDFSTGARKRAVAHFDVKRWLQRHQEVFEVLLE